MLDIPEEQIFTLYEYEKLKEELTFKDILFSIIYDTKQYLGIDISFIEIIKSINQDILNKYLDYLKSFLDPYINKLDIILDTKKIYNKYCNTYTNNIPNCVNKEYESSSYLSIFLDSLLELSDISNRYYSFV